jgi:hypothetical protein
MVKKGSAIALARARTAKCRSGVPSGTTLHGRRRVGVKGMESIGQHLRRSREQRAKSIADLARETRIPRATLDLLENDRFDDMPGEVFVRGFLKAYARAVSISVDETMARYTLSRRAASVEHLPATAPRPGIPTRRRVGVALGFVALLLLFTIALSVLLKPRGQRVPGELAAVDRPNKHFSS